MKIDLADIATNEKKRLQGFKVLGVFPFYLRYIRVDTHIRLCAIREKIRSIYTGEITLEQFYDADLQSKITPLIKDYIVTALTNNRAFSFLIKKLLKRKINQCGHYHMFNLYVTVLKLNEPAFFLSYWKLIVAQENTLLKEQEQS